MKTETKTTAEVLKLTDDDRLAQLSNIIVTSFDLLTSYDFKEISNLTGLSLSTIHRLYVGNYSLKMQWNTVNVLAAAAGLKLVTVKSRIQLRLVRNVG